MRSPGPVCLGIAQALVTELVRHGLQVMMIKPDGLNTALFHEFVSKQSASASISTSVNNATQHKAKVVPHATEIEATEPA